MRGTQANRHRRALPWLVGAVALVQFVTMSPASGAEPFEDNQVPILDMAAEGDLHIFSDDSLEPEISDPPSMLALWNQTTATFCADADSGTCAGQSDLSYVAHLPICSESEKVDCIVSVSARGPSASDSPGTFSRYFPDRSATSYTGKPSIKLPTGRAPSVWTIPGAAHPGGSDYVVAASLRGGTSSRSGATFRVVVTAVSLKTDADTSADYRMPYWVTPGRMAGPAADRGKYRCAYWGENGACLLSRSFPADTRFTVKVRLAAEPSGWLHGRINDPAISFTKNGDAVDVEISALPVQVPAFAVAKKHLEFPAAIQAAFNPNGKYPDAGSRRPGAAELTDLTKRNAEYDIVAWKDQSFDQFAMVTDVIADTASYAPWVWRVRSLGGEEMRNASKCLTTGDGVKGIVTTNATVYGSGPPAYNSTTQTLDYKVAAPHFTRTQEVFKGAYYLIMRSDVARCFYNFTSAPVKATITVVEANGASSSAVTSVSEANGWLRLSATGFTHSAPTVKVSLSQDSAEQTKQVLLVTPTGSTGSATRANYVRTSASGARATLTINLLSKQTVSIYRRVGGKLTLLKKMSGKAGTNTFITVYKRTYSFVVKDSKGKVIPPRISSTSFRVGLLVLR